MYYNNAAVLYSYLYEYCSFNVQCTNAAHTEPNPTSACRSENAEQNSVSAAAPQTAQWPAHPREQYPLERLLCDLVTFAALRLRVGGHLAVFVPAYRPAYASARCLPHADAVLVLAADCEQPLSTKWSRRLVVYRKVQQPVPCLHVMTLWVAAVENTRIRVQL